jgi:hypothetical protein
MIHIDPKRKLIVVLSSAWEKATDRTMSVQRNALIEAVTKAVDSERASR